MTEVSSNEAIEFSELFSLVSDIFNHSVREIQQQNQDSMELVWKDRKVREMLLDALSTALFKEINQPK